MFFEGWTRRVKTANLIKCFGQQDLKIGRNSLTATGFDLTKKTRLLLAEPMFGERLFFEIKVVIDGEYE